MNEQHELKAAKERICYEALNFARAAFVANRIEEAIWFRVLLEIEQAFGFLGVDREAIHKLMKEGSKG